MDITEITKTILKNRGIREEADIEEYLSQKPQRAHDPFLMKGIDEGSELILSAIRTGRKICIYGDYDCDGVSSVFLLKSVLSELAGKEKICHYIPSRFTEGYGLNKEAIDKIRTEGASLIITVDCGISSADEVSYAKSLGLDVIITDHHNVGRDIPECIVIDPKQQDCSYPFDGLCGCGVAYKLAQALQKKTGFDRSVLLNLLDVAGIATIGDVVPLVDENRTMAKYGLYAIRSGRRKSLRTLISMMERRYDTLDSYGVSFGVVPHINAAGRMANAENALALLETDDDDEMKNIAARLIEYNSERRRVQESAYERCLEKIQAQCPDSLFPVVRDDEAHEGIIGIVAGKLCEKLGRPVIVLTGKDGVLKGSGRSIDAVNMYSVVEAQKDILDAFGGHAAACGLTLKEANADALRAALEREMERLLEADPDLLAERIICDMEIEPGDVTLKLAEELKNMEPFGNANERPVFLMRDVELRSMFFMGKEKQHVRFKAYKNGKSVSCVLFFKTDEYRDILEEGRRVDMLGSVSENEFRGSISAQFGVDKIIERKDER